MILHATRNIFLRKIEKNIRILFGLMCCNGNIVRHLTSSPYRHKPRTHYIDQPSDALFSIGKTLVSELSAEDISDKQCIRSRKKLTFVLYQLYLKEEKSDLINLFSIISKQKFLNQSHYAVMMRYYADQNDHRNVKRMFNLLSKRDDIQLHPRCVFPLVVTYLKLGEFQLAKAYLHELLASVRTTVSDILFVDILNTCTHIRNPRNDENMRTFVEDIFVIFEDINSESLIPDTVKAVTRWFERY